jgi:hypothetical protein
MATKKQLVISLPDGELEIIRQKTRDAGMNISRFMRLAALGAEFRQPIRADVPVLINEVRKAESALDRLLKETEKDGAADKEKTEEVLEKLLHAEELIREAYEYKWQ